MRRIATCKKRDNWPLNQRTQHRVALLQYKSTQNLSKVVCSTAWAVLALGLLCITRWCLWLLTIMLSHTVHDKWQAEVMKG